MSPLTRKQLLALRRNLMTSLAVCVGVIFLVHFLPKNPEFANPTRLFLTVTVFASAFLLCHQLLGGRRDVMLQVYGWRFADAPKPVERAWKEYLYSLDQVMSIAVYLVGALLLSLFLMTMANWFPILQRVSWFYNLLWWLGVTGMILYPLFGGFLFNELAQRFRTLREQVATSGDYRPRSLSGDRDFEYDAKPLAFASGGDFHGGGIRWRWQDFTRSCIVFGLPGSGKTSCVLNTILEGIIGSAELNRESPGGLILDPKGDYVEKIRVLCEKYERAGDLVVIDPYDQRSSIRWNPLDSDDDELELASRFGAVLESLGMSSGENTFWIDAAQRFIRHSIALLRFTNGTNEPPSFRDIQSLVSSFDAIAERTDRLDLQDPGVEPCLSFFGEWIDMAPNQRSGIQTHVTNMLDPFFMEPYATIFSGKSTMRISEMVASGKILYVHMPLAEKEMMARTIGIFVKLEYYREILRSLNKTRPTFFLCDEFQQFFTYANSSGDADFFERSRQSNHGNIVATHNVAGLSKRSPQREPVTNLLGLCATKLFLRNTDDETNEYASKLFGEEIMAMGGAAGGQQAGRGFGPRVISQNDQFVRRVGVDTFKDLAVPGEESDPPYCETMAFLGARQSGTRDLRKLKWPLHLITANANGGTRR